MKICESAIERDMRAIASSDREREITHLCFYLYDYDSLEMIDRYKEIRGALAVVEKNFFIKNSCIDDRHITNELPNDILNILGGEYMESHFEVLESLEVFFSKIQKTGLLYMGTHNRLWYYQTKNSIINIIKSN
jgi:hypothetical protein